LHMLHLFFQAQIRWVNCRASSGLLEAHIMLGKVPSSPHFGVWSGVKSDPNL